MNSPVVINGKEVERIVYRDRPVITLRMVDELHERPSGTARRNFNENKKHLIENEDYFVVPYDEWSVLGDRRTNFVRRSDTGQRNPATFSVRNSYAEKRGYAGDMIFLTQTGYLMLVKSFNDNLAWLVQRQLVNRYFEPASMGYPYPERQGFLPRPGMSMDAIAAMCREADKTLHGLASLRGLNFYGYMPVDDLVEMVLAKYPENSDEAVTIVRYFHAMLDADLSKYGIEKGRTDGGHWYLQGLTSAFFTAFLSMQKKELLPKVATSLAAFGAIMSREADALEELGWKRTLGKRAAGYRHYRFEHRPHPTGDPDQD